ncbi:MAG: PqqD family peptide modification chaperone [Candidatus Rokubacteria bacterium]|nr:PqqD family peptide modification chaperone [Candidatus Rokubacteria bacterium]
MTGPLFSTSWYRVAGLRPRLRSHAQIHRHQYRGQTWYILQDRSTERFHRFSPAAYLVMGLMDGQRTVQEIWETACGRLGDDAPTQDEVIQLLSQLHQTDVLLCDVPSDAAELLHRHERQTRRQWQSRAFSVFSWRFPLFDPDRMLRLLLPIVRPLIGWSGAILWLVVVAPALVLAAVHWSDLTSDVLDRVLAPQNLLPLWLLYPIIKVFHEFGHAFLTKAYGGEVHDMGVMLLVLTPIPYVDASAASAFREKWHRILVGAGGILVELFLASLALFLWLSVEPGLTRTLAYNAIVIAGVSTVLFNGNPLLRYDGYYVLADLVEIPNLRSRATAYLGFLGERYLFGRKEAEPPTATPGERAWFVGYGIASFLYRIFVVVAILLFVMDRFFLLGMIFAALAAIGWAAVPLGKGLAFLFTHPRLRSVRTRAIAVTALLVAAPAGVIGFVPAPYRSRAEGVVWIPDEAFVRAGVDGFIERVVARPGTRVRRGDVLILCRDPVLSAQVQELEARLRELEARYAEQHVKDRGKAEILKEEFVLVRENLARARERAGELTIRSRADGTFVAPLAADLPGRFVRQGELLGYVVEFGTITVRAVVPQVFIDLVRQQTREVEVRLAERLAETFPAVIKREVPGASERLPSPALGSQGGGQLATDPLDKQGVKAMQKVFQVDLELPSPLRVINVGGRVHVRFDHGWAPLGLQWYRQVRQLFLSRFNV